MGVCTGLRGRSPRLESRVEHSGAGSGARDDRPIAHPAGGGPTRRMTRGRKTYAVLLRGINVGGKNKLPMPALLTLLEDAGYDGVATYIQSGNVVLRSSLAESTLTRAIEKQIAEEFSLAIRVVVRTHDELERIAGANPFLVGGADPTGLHVVFLDAAPGGTAIATLDPDRSPGDEFVVAGSEIYLRYANGSGRSKLTLDYLERRLGVAGTARNWNTVLKLVELTAPGSSG